LAELSGGGGAAARPDVSGWLSGGLALGEGGWLALAAAAPWAVALLIWADVAEVWASCAACWAAP
jgi:hypothetical protein